MNKSEAISTTCAQIKKNKDEMNDLDLLARDCEMLRKEHVLLSLLGKIS